MSRRVDAFTTVRTEGGLMPMDLLARVAAGGDGLPGFSPEAYHLAPDERLNEAISRSWNRLVGTWTRFNETVDQLPTDERTATSITRQRWSLLVFQELGYGQLQATRPIEVEGKDYPVSHLWGAVPVHLVGARVDLNRRSEGIAGAARMSPHALVQELLNRSDQHLWGVVCNGLQLRLLRNNVALTRQAFVEFDLQAMFAGQEYADFALLWLLCHQSRLEAEIPEKCLLEEWMTAASERGIRMLDQLSDAVEAALEELGRGFLAHAANTALRDALRDGRLDRQDYYRQLLRIIYRLLFVLVAEARGVLLAGPDEPAKQRYRRYYSLSRIQRLAQAHRGGPHDDLWRQVRLVSEGLGQPEGIPALGLPGLGSFLWSHRATPELDQAELANRHLLTALRRLSSVRDGEVTRAVDYRNLDSEELGSVYESLLELHPELSLETRSFALAKAAGNERKKTGSYYTPTPLINELLNSALDPVLAEAARSADPEQAILGLRVLDPACGSGHFLIAAAHRIAKQLATVRTGDDEPPPDEQRHALRDVVASCLHGIDVNEMAVELCKVSLWLEAVEPGRPLAFLDHRIVCGNSLLGTTPRLLSEGVPDTAFKKPLTGDNKTIFNELKKINKRERKGQQTLLYGPAAPAVEAVAKAYTEIDALPDDSVGAVEAKEDRWHKLLDSTEYEQARFAADAWCAAFVARKRQGDPVITTGFVRQAEGNPPAKLDAATVRAVRRLQQEYRFLHLHLVFPDVFHLPPADEPAENEHTGWNGGFDVVLGNPPWERVKLQEKEFFASRLPDIADAATAAERKQLIAELAKSSDETDRALHEEFLAALRRSEGQSHLLRWSGRYPLCGLGDVNTYAVFAENMRDGLSPVGRVGVIVPLGIATDDTTKAFFGDLVDTKTIVSLFGFENEEFLFPGVDHRVTFSLLTMAGRGEPSDTVELCFFARQVSSLAEADRRFTLAPEDFRAINPNTGTSPIFRTRRDAMIARSVYRRVPVLINQRSENNPWNVGFMRMLDMANDSDLFRTREELDHQGWTLRGNFFERDGDRYLPLYEGKMAHHYDHRYGTYDGQTQAQANQKTLPRLTSEQHADPTEMVLPKYWVGLSDVAEVAPIGAKWYLGWRSTARSTDTRSLIPAVLPPTGVGHKFLLMTRPDTASVACLMASLSSFCVDYVARLKLGGTDLSYFIMRQLPIPPPEWFEKLASWDRERTLADWITPRVLELTYTAWDLAGFGRDLGWHGPPFRWDEERRAAILAELDACIFHIYGIERDDVAYVMDTFPNMPKNGEADFGEHHTKRAILEVYDAMATANTSGVPYQTVLTPPPADPSVAHSPDTRPDWAPALQEADDG